MSGAPRSTRAHSIPRRFRALLGAAIALTLALSLASPAEAQADQMAGMQTHLLWSNVDSAEVSRQLDAVKAAGGGIVRVDVGWSSIEQDGKGNYSSWYLNKVDDVVNQAQTRGIKLLFSFDWTPCWASSAPASLKQDCAGSWWSRGVQYYPPKDPADYADGLAYMIRRYGDRVAAWEIWNEPNSQTYFKSSDPVGDYAAMVKAAYPAAKAADPNATIVAGSLSDSDFEFTRALYDAGIKGNFDAFSVHPYSADRSPLNLLSGQSARYTFIRGVPAVHDLMVNRGDDKPLWLTEFGWNTSTIRNDEPWLNGVSESTQALYVEQAFDQMKNWSYVPVGIYFNLKNTGPDTSDHLDNYGLLNYDNSPKQAYASFRTEAEELAAASSGDGSGDTTGDGGGDTTGDGGATDSSPELRLGARRQEGVLNVRGYTPKTGAVRLRALKYRPAADRYRVAFRKRVEVDGPNRFAHHLIKRKISQGRWQVKAVLAGTQAHARLRLH